MKYEIPLALLTGGPSCAETAYVKLHHSVGTDLIKALSLLYIYKAFMSDHEATLINISKYPFIKNLLALFSTLT